MLQTFLQAGHFLGVVTDDSFKAVRLPVELMDRADQLVGQDGHRSRAAVITSALRAYLEAAERKARRAHRA